jgi:hypothetical protein
MRWMLIGSCSAGPERDENFLARNPDIRPMLLALEDASHVFKAAAHTHPNRQFSDWTSEVEKKIRNGEVRSL